MKTLTKYFDVTKLSNEIKKPVIDIAKDNNISEDSINFIRKGLETYKEPDFNPGERSVITYISTGDMDRDGDIVLPSGVDLTYYNKHPVVMWAHNYKSLPIGRCAWIKSDPSGMGLIAKTLYAHTPEADLIYNYRKDGFFLCVSIGFVPTKYVSAHDIDKKEEFASELQNAVAKGWITKDKIKDVKNIIQKWSLIEFSDVSIPANPAALTIAVNKGLIKKEELEIVEDKSIQIEELKPYKTIIQIDGLKDMPKVEDKIEIVKIEEENKNVVVKDVIEEKTENKTNTPPTELINKEIMSNVEQKKADKKGNPSISDIMTGIRANMKKMREDMDKMSMEKVISTKYENEMPMSYMGVEDLYPIDYPHGHVICGYAIDYSSPVTYCDYKYKYDMESKSCEMGKMTEMEISYTPKGICQTEIDSINNIKSIKSKLDKITVEEVDKFDTILPVSHTNLKKENGNRLYFFDVNNKFYKIEFSKEFIEGGLYLGQKKEQALNHFSKFVASEPKSMDEWKDIQSKLIEFYIISAPGKDDILKFCKDNCLSHKDYSIKEEDESEIIEKGIEETENEIRIRVQDPSLFDSDSFRYKTIKSSKPRVKAILGKKKGSSTMELQSYRFPKEDGWDKNSAKVWVKEHGKKSFEYIGNDSYELSEETIIGILQANNKNMIITLEEVIGKILGKAQI